MKLDRSRWAGCWYRLPGYKFCPMCGKPLTESAWAGLERKLSALEPNDPLTLEELREMDGEPVWLETNKDRPQWAFVIIDHEEFISFNCADGTEWEFDLYGDNDGVDWLARRRKPEEGTK